jgi:REP element-mobilizing transposase RayT
MSEDDFAELATIFVSTRESLKFVLTAWVFLPDHLHAVIFPP